MVSTLVILKILVVQKLGSHKDPTIDVSGNIVSVGWGVVSINSDVFISTGTDGGDIFGYSNNY